MIGERIVALFAGVVGIAALHFDGDDVDWLVVVRAAGLSVEINSAHMGARGWHWRTG